MIQQSGIIYVYEEVTHTGETVRIPIEQTPDNLEDLAVFQTPVPTRIPTYAEIQTNPLPYSAPTQTQPRPSHARSIGLGILVMALGGIFATNATRLRLEVAYRSHAAKLAVNNITNPTKPLPPSAPLVFEPLMGADGKEITPVNTEFSIIVPKVGINAPVIATVDPSDSEEYNKILEEGVAHSATSFKPDQDGTVYLFSHSTNYEWFVKDLNAIFYLVKDLLPGDTIVVFYKGVRYTYELKEKRVVKPKEITYLVPEAGKRSLILQTCWPPGSVAERLLLFADLVEAKGKQI
jgi:LPXTG-site transpeptidase (sortase) family protein